MFRIINEKRFPLPTENPDGKTWLHLATVQYSPPGKVARLYVAFCDSQKQTYIEELDPIKEDFVKIEDHTLWSELKMLMESEGLLGIKLGREYLVAETKNIEDR